MFQRQAREPFPVRNILILAILVFAGLLYVLKNRKEEPAPPAQEGLEAPMLMQDTVVRDSLK